MQLYVVIHEDRHADVKVTVFSKASDAIIYARHSTDGEKNIEESDVEGWLYHATYGYEGDSIRVEVTTLDAPQ